MKVHILIWHLAPENGGSSENTAGKVLMEWLYQAPTAYSSCGLKNHQKGKVSVLAAIKNGVK